MYSASEVHSLVRCHRAQFLSNVSKSLYSARLEVAILCPEVHRVARTVWITNVCVTGQSIFRVYKMQAILLVFRLIS